MLKVGLIGAGGIGRVHALSWKILKDSVELVAIADVNAEQAQKVSEECGCKMYTDAFEMLQKEEFDVVDICLPTFLHADYVIRVMDYVKNIIVEKPICLYEEEAQRLLDAQEKSGALIQVGHVVRFMDDYRYLKELVDAGTYGKVVAGTFSRLSPRPVWMRGHDDVNRTGTMALDFHIHDADYVRYLMDGEPEDVQAWAARDSEGIVQHLRTAYRYGNALLCTEASWNYPVTFPFSESYRVRLEKAAVVLDTDGIKVYPDEGEPFTPENEQKLVMDLGINVSDIGPYLTELRYFADVIVDGKKVLTSLEDAIAAFRLVQKELALVGGAQLKK